MSGADGAPRSDPDSERPSALMPASLTDRGNARLFARLNRDRFRHVEGIGWHSWDGYRWKHAGGEGAVLWAAGEMAEDMAHRDPEGVLGDREVARHRKHTLSTAGMKALLAQARTAPALSLDPAALDADPWALCTPAGVVDLRTGRVREADPARDLHSRATAVAPLPTPVPRWHRFLADTFGEDEEGREMIDFLHLLLGYS
ncbi:DNA primase, partial [Streptomyces sp. NPDC051014]